MGKLVDLTGKVFGRLTVIKKAESSNSRVFWLCKCSCGNTKTIQGGNMSRGKISSCGCIKSEMLTRKNKANATHGLSKTRLHVIWDGIKKRASKNRSANNKNRDDYFNRGIILCDEWDSSFESFLLWSKQNGYKEDLQIDRINNDKGYYPENCRWTTSAINSLNKRNTIPLEIVKKGISMYNDGYTIAHIARVLGVKYGGLYQAITGRRGKSRIEKTTKYIKGK